MIKLANISASLKMWLMVTLGLGPGMGDVFYLCESGSAYHLWLLSNRVDTAHISFTLPLAYAAMTDKRNDVLIVMPGAYNLTAAFVWDKDNCFVLGANHGTPFSPRARIITAAAVTVTPMFTASGDHNFFKNVTLQNGGSHATLAAVCMLLTGLRNKFDHCHIAGGLDSVAAGNAANRSLVIRSGENVFEDCVIGVDTIQGGNVARAQIDFDAANSVGGAAVAPRNIFRRTKIMNYGGASNVFVNIANHGIDRFLLFEDCQLQNFGTALTQGFSINAGANGNVLLKNSPVQGATALETTDSGLLYGNDIPGAGTGSRWVALTG